MLTDDGTNLTDSGTLTVQGASLTAGTAGTAFTATFGQGTTGTDAATVRIRSGNGASTYPILTFDRNTTADFVMDTAGGLGGAARFGDASGYGFYNNTSFTTQELTISAAGQISRYNATAKAASENGTPFTTISTSLTGQTANKTATNLVASATAGRYRMCCALNVTTAASISSTIPDCNLICTDPTDSVAKTAAVVTGNLFPAVTNPGTGVGITGCGICNAKSATAIQYSTTNYASSAAGMAYDAYITLEAM